MVRSAFGTAVESGDASAVIALFADDIVFRSPVVFEPYEGREAAGAVLAAAMTVFEDFHYVNEASDGETEILVFEARIGDRQVQGIDLVRLDAEGRVAEFTVFVRPLSGVQALIEGMRKRLEPGP